MATLEEILKSPEEVTLLIEDFDAFGAQHRLDKDSMARAANYSALASQVLRRTPMTLTGLTDKMVTVDMGGFGPQGATFTDNYINQFTDTYTNSGADDFMQQLGLRAKDFNLGRTIGGRGRGF